jgi:hypothetical protein
MPDNLVLGGKLFRSKRGGRTGIVPQVTRQQQQGAANRRYTHENAQGTVPPPARQQTQLGNAVGTRNALCHRGGNGLHVAEPDAIPSS